jgi:hypothetical protein
VTLFDGGFQRSELFLGLFQVLLIDELQPFSFVYAMLIEEGNEEAAECETCDRCP